MGAGEWKGLLQVGGSKTAPLRRARGQTAGCGLLVARCQALDSRIADGRISRPAKHCRQHSHDPLGRNVLQTQRTPGCKRFLLHSKGTRGISLPRLACLHAFSRGAAGNVLCNWPVRCSQPWTRLQEDVTSITPARLTQRRKSCMFWPPPTPLNVLPSRFDSPPQILTVLAFLLLNALSSLQEKLPPEHLASSPALSSPPYGTRQTTPSRIT